ncbi:MAG TPA: NUDIX domain-containing protein [Phycisphaerales bacterium]|nr:NUDIX domain-containing protein [Phycisphaerales bacterium]
MPRVEVIARGLLIEDGRILLCESLAGGYLYLPGGHVEFGESAPAALRRELLEEAGLEVVASDLALVSEAVFDAGARRHHEINLVFHVARRDRRHEVRSLEPAIAFRWVGLADLAGLDVRPVGVRGWLAGRPGPGAAWLSEVGEPPP